jgi:hypothetical protein
MKRSLYLLALVVVAMLAPVRSKADSFTLSMSGSSKVTDLTSFTLGPGKDKFTVVIPVSAGLGPSFFKDAMDSKGITSITIDDYKTIHGVPTLVETLKFGTDLVSTIGESGLGNNPTDKVIFSFDKVTYTYSGVGSGPGPGPSATPEPSMLILLGSGIAGLCGLRKKQRA